MKMALSVSMRRALLLMVSGTLCFITLAYWNQKDIKPQGYTDVFEREPRIRPPLPAASMPVEKMWSYICDDDRCVRRRYDEKLGKRNSFTACSMTCGTNNIWPKPTGKVKVTLTSLKFTVKEIRLLVDTPFAEVRRYTEKAFEHFLAELRVLQRFDNRDAAANAAEAGDKTKQQSDHETYKSAALLMSRDNRAQHNDLDIFNIKVSIDKDPDLNLKLDTDESYKIVSSFDSRVLSVHITAKSFFGARHGLWTLLQLIWYDDEDELLHTYLHVEVKDSPKFSYRGLMLDTSRHFFSVEAIKRTIVGMAHAKLNRFHWHITDAQSFPYVSRHYPELAEYGAYSESETYSQEDVRKVTEFAKVHGIQVIIEIDAPAHAGNGWNWGPKNRLGELSLCINQQPWNLFCGEPPCGQLNPKNNHTYLILQRLYEELLQLTGPTDFFHIGGDEVNLDCWAQYFNDTDLRGLWCDFMLQALARLKTANNNVTPKIVAVWSSALTNTKCLPNSQFAVQVWGGSTWQENYDIIDNGFNVIFSHVDAWYLDCGFGSWRPTGDAACSPYRTWQNVYKHRPWERMRLDRAQKKQVLGGEVCLWTEQVDEGQLDNRLWPRSAALGERLWSDPDDDDFDIVPKDVFRRISILRNRLTELGIKAEALFPKYCTQNSGECI